MKRLSLALCLATLGCGHRGGDGEGTVDAGDGTKQDAGSVKTSADANMTPLAITPLDKVITTAPGTMPTVQYMATADGGSVAPQWTLDHGQLGNLDVSSGLFTTLGTLGGIGHVTATLGNETATTTITINLQLTENGDPGYPAGTPGAGGYGGVGGAGPAGSASPAQIGVLNGSPTVDPAVHILYPYDGTVWPQGLLPPLLAWDPGAHTFNAVMVQIKSNHYSYTGTFGGNATPFLNMLVPTAVWNTLTYSNDGASDPVSVTFTFADANTNTAVGPYTITWHFAPGTLQGTVYYNSYGTSLVTNSGPEGPDSYGSAFGAAVLAIQPGATAPIVAAGTNSGPLTGSGSGSGGDSGCRVCHMVSANGQSLMAQEGNNYAVSNYYDLQTSSESAVAATVSVWPALYPDGTWYISDSGVAIASAGDSTSRAYTSAGVLETTQPTGLPAGLQATLPVFSPDGKHLGFNFYASTSSGGDKKSLATLAYDPTTQTFSGLTTLFTPTTGAVSWSSFLPNNSAMVFEDELVSGNGQFGYTWKTGQGQLYWVDLATQTPYPLNAANGIGSNNQPYLPTYGGNHTGSGDAVLNYEPTVNPVVSGGYAWVVFTSRRLYGNVATTSAYNSDPRDYPWRTEVTPKKLWVAAINLNAPPGTDASSPAFYLPGQELYAGNARGFWTVNPCLANGSSCETGDQCCGGYCEEGSGGSGTVCTNVQPTCSQQYEACSTTANCCGGSAAGIYCIDGYCAADMIQ